VVRGEFKNNKVEGYAHIKLKNNDEYDGEWKGSKSYGVGVFKNAATNRIEKAIFDGSKVMRLLEVI